MKSPSRIQAGQQALPRIGESSQEPQLLSQLRSIEDVTNRISACIEELTAAGYHETAAMLAIARVDLLARRHGITEDELQYIILAPRSPTAD